MKNTQSTHSLLIPFLVVTILVVTAIAYSPALNGPFLFDDYPNIINNDDLYPKEITAQTLSQAAYGIKSGPIGRPISYLSFLLNTQLCASGFCFKVSNLLLHLTNGVLIFILFTLLLPHLLRDDEAKPGKMDSRLLAFSISALWLLHPLNFTTVMYTVQRMEGLSTFFSLLALISYIKFRSHSLHKPLALYKNILAIVLVTLLVTLATHAKENGILVLLFISAIELQVFKLRFHSEAIKKISVIAIITLVAGYITFLAIYSGNYSYREFTLTERLMTQFRVVLNYVQLILLPNIFDMGLFHDTYEISRSLLSPITTLLSLVIIIGWLAAAFILRNKYPILLLGSSLFFIGHSLESTILPLEMIHEHRNYFSSTGIILIISWAILRFSSTRNVKKTFIIVSISALFLLTFLRATHWKDDYHLSYWMTQNHPESVRSHLYAGKASLEAGLQQEDKTLITESIEHYQLAYAIDRNLLSSSLSLMSTQYGLELEVTKEQISQLYDNARNIHFTPQEGNALFAPYRYCFNTESCKFASEIYITTLETALENPSLRGRRRCDAYTILSDLYGRDKKLEKALRLSGLALECNPDAAQNHLNYANLLIYSGSPDLAYKHIQLALLISQDTKIIQNANQNIKLINTLYKNDENKPLK